ncbi:MAG TPA: Gfo/Idh/MocA family oxidoreductase [Bryobacteraceae bacterium]|nr:Gfo/Idh/MocA family oxidoreductase [Bryobacteraceae bacterium]
MTTKKPSKKLGLGVLGLGEGRSIISAGLRSELWDVVQVCDLNEDLCRARCAEFGLSRYTTSYDEMLADRAVEVVGIYTPDHLHAPHTLQALAAGKHVICTKPFLDNLSRAREVLQAARASGRLVMVGQSSRFFAPFARQREHFDQGGFGALHSVETHYNADHRWFLSKGWAKLDTFKWLYGGLSHPVDLVRWYVPDVEEVMGYATLTPNGREVGLQHPDTFHFVFKSKGGVIGRISGTYSSPVVPIQRDSHMSCILRASEGASHADYYDLRYAWKIGEHSAIETFEDKDDYYFRFGGHSHHAGEYQNYIELFARSLADGTTPKPDFAEGIVTVALMQAMDEAAESGKAVKVADILARHGLSDLVNC